MKKYFKIHFLILLLAFSVNNTLAQEPCEPGFTCDDSDNGGNDASGGLGRRGVPIDDYLPLLIITAVTIAGIYSYKQRKLIQK